MRNHVKEAAKLVLAVIGYAIGGTAAGICFGAGAALGAALAIQGVL